MDVFRALEQIPAGFGPSVAVIGNFDGVHLGHQDVLKAVVTEARAKGWRSIAVTFDPHPEQFLRPHSAPKLLTTMDDRIGLMHKTGIDAVLVLRFDEELCHMPARAFVERILIGKLGVGSIHEGANFRFGHCAEAGVTELSEFGREFGFSVTVHSPVETHGMAVSSTAVRRLVAEGDVRRARWMLGRPFSVAGKAATGRGIGSKLVVPTINLAPHDGLLPGFGVYATELTFSGFESVWSVQAVTNVGNRPTFGEPSFAVESYILDFEETFRADDYDAASGFTTTFLLRLRPERTWPSPEALKAQIMKDVTKAKRYFRLISL
jgi:riboflavin kinase/FMN adenylyltransferase